MISITKINNEYNEMTYEFTDASLTLIVNGVKYGTFYNAEPIKVMVRKDEKYMYMTVDKLDVDMSPYSTEFTIRSFEYDTHTNYIIEIL